MASHKGYKHAVTMQRTRTAARLRSAEIEPSRAEKLETLRQAMRSTADAAMAPLLGILIWPARFPRDAILTRLGVVSRRFTIVNENGQTWRHLYGASPEMAVFDPFEVTACAGYLPQLIRSRRFERMLVGADAVRAELKRLGEVQA